MIIPIGNFRIYEDEDSIKLAKEVNAGNSASNRETERSLPTFIPTFRKGESMKDCLQAYCTGKNSSFSNVPRITSSNHQPTYSGAQNMKQPFEETYSLLSPSKANKVCESSQGKSYEEAKETGEFNINQGMVYSTERLQIEEASAEKAKGGGHNIYGSDSSFLTRNRLNEKNMNTNPASKLGFIMK